MANGKQGNNDKNDAILSPNTSTSTWQQPGTSERTATAVASMSNLTQIEVMSTGYACVAHTVVSTKYSYCNYSPLVALVAPAPNKAFLIVKNASVQRFQERM